MAIFFVKLPGLPIFLIFRCPEQDSRELESFLIDFFVFRARSRSVASDINPSYLSHLVISFPRMVLVDADWIDPEDSGPVARRF